MSAHEYVIGGIYEITQDGKKILRKVHENGLFGSLGDDGGYFPAENYDRIGRRVLIIDHPDALPASTSDSYAASYYLGLVRSALRKEERA